MKPNGHPRRQLAVAWTALAAFAALLACVLLRFLVSSRVPGVENQPRPGTAGEGASRSAADGTAGDEEAAGELPPSPDALLLRGRVVRPGDDPKGPAVPVVGAAVRLTANQEHAAAASFPARELRTGPDGRFDFAGIPPALPILFEVDEPGSGLCACLLKLEEDPGGKSRVRDVGDVELWPAGKLEVLVTDPEENPLQHASVSLELQAFDAGSHFQVDRSEHFLLHEGGGLYTLERAPSVDNFLLRLSSPGFVARIVWLEDEETSDQPIHVKLRPGSTILGRVLTVDEEPIAGARVQCQEESRPVAETDAGGWFRLEDVDRSCLCEARAPGFAMASARLALHDDQLVLRLIRESVIAGTVVSRKTGAALENARVQLWGEARYYSTTLGARFHFGNLPPGSYRIEATGELHLPRHKSVVVAEGEAVQGLELALEESARIPGRVTDARTGDPIGGAIVKAVLSGDEAPYLPAESKTRMDGTFELVQVPSGETTVSVQRENYRGASAVLQVTLSPLVPLTFALERGGSISGKVVDEGGRPMPCSRACRWKRR